MQYSLPAWMLRAALAALIMTAALSSGFAEELLVIEQWVELDQTPSAPGSSAAEETRSLREEAVGRLLDEARYIFSAMIYGFTFEYQPSDRSRGVEERFQLTPVYQIPVGDPAVSVLQSWVDGTRLYVRLGYELHEHQAAWFRSWQSHAIPEVDGAGAAQWFGGFSQRVAAIQDALRSGCREYLRARVFARPQRVTGSILITDDPVINVYAGEYTARVTFSLRVDEIRHYDVY